MGIFLLISFVRLISILADKVEKSFPSRRLFGFQVETILTFFPILWVLIFIFSIIQPPKELLLAAGGNIAVAIGLSLKDLVASIIAGVILLFDRPFQVGDRVSLMATMAK